MKKLLLLFFFSMLIFRANAQLGLTVSPTSAYSPEWQVAVENFIAHRRTSFLGYGVSGVLDYQIPTRSKAISFSPALFATNSEVSYDEHQFELYSIGFQGNINLMPFLVSKEKEGKTLFIVQFSPGLSYVHQRFDRPVLQGGEFNGEYERFTRKQLAFHAGIHFLLQFRLTKLLSISPQAGIRYFPNLEWSGFTEQVSDGAMARQFDRTHLRHLTLGVRFGVNFGRG